MDYYQYIADKFQVAIETISMSVDFMAEPIEQASQHMVEALLSDRKIISCGNGVDAALAQLFTCNLLDRFREERPALPALTLNTDNASLTAIAHSSGIEQIFSRPLQALGQAGDILLCINSSGSAVNLQRAVRTAQERNIGIVVVSNGQDEELVALLRPEDVNLLVHAPGRANAVELHTMVIHCICDLIDHSLFGTHVQD